MPLETKHVLIAAGVLVVAVVVIRSTRKSAEAAKLKKYLPKGVNDIGKGYYPIVYNCFELYDPKLTDAENTSMYNECVKSDCSSQCQLDFVGMGACLQTDEAGNCLVPPTDEESAAAIAKCAGQCYTDYSTEIQPMEVARKKLMARMIMKAKMGDAKAKAKLSKGQNEDALKWL